MLDGSALLCSALLCQQIRAVSRRIAFASNLQRKTRNTRVSPRDPILVVRKTARFPAVADGRWPMWSPEGIGCGCHVALRTLSAKAAGFPPDCAIKEIIRPGTRGFVRAVQSDRCPAKSAALADRQSPAAQPANT
jgi:hypothetical protein